MARVAEQFSVVDEDDRRVTIADDVTPTAPGVSREIILHPGWAPQVARSGETAKYLNGPMGRAWGTGGRLMSIELIVVRYFTTLAGAIAFKGSHERKVPALGELTLEYAFGSTRLESTGYFSDIDINAGESFSLRVQTHYRWTGTPFTPGSL